MSEITILRLFSKNLTRMMKEDEITQEELAKAIGVSQAMISKYITGQCMPSFFTIVRISDELCCSLDDFLNEK